MVEAAAQTAMRCEGRHVLAIQDTTVIRSEGGGGLYLHPVLAVDADDGAILGLTYACFLKRTGGKKGSRGARRSRTRRAGVGWTGRRGQWRSAVGPRA